MVEFSLPAYRKRNNWYYAVVSEKDAIQVFKSEYAPTGLYIASGERMVSDAFDTGTEPCTKQEFMEALNLSMANLLSLTNKVKEDTL
jgi:hypothetical protein